MEKFFISDTHFGDEVLNRSMRGLSNKENEEIIVNNWNKVVRKSDTVYMLGDICKDWKDVEVLRSLNGDKVAILGNHDDESICRELYWLGIPMLGSLEFEGFMVTHIPIHEKEMRWWKGNIHGHTHVDCTFDNGYKYEYFDFGDKYFNVNVELNDYTPVNFKTIQEKIK